LNNIEVVTLLTHMLEIAKSDPMFIHCAVAMVKEPDIGIFHYEGPAASDRLQRQTVAEMLADLDKSIANQSLPPRDESLPANRVVYNLAHDPISFDFITWLIQAEMTRVREGAPAPLRVAFWKGKGNLVADNAKVKLWMANVFLPALKLIGAISDPTSILGRHHEAFLPVNINTWSRSGEAVPRFSSGEEKQKADIITITLRESHKWTHRNSNLVAWLQLADYLAKQGENVVFVRDTAKADEQLPRFMTCPRASRDLVARVALYERAKANLFVANGPGMLASFCDCSYLMFVELHEEGHPDWTNTPSFWAEQMGLGSDTQWPWARGDQRLVWKPDTFENLAAAWEDYRGTLGCVAGNSP